MIKVTIKGTPSVKQLEAKFKKFPDKVLSNVRVAMVKTGGAMELDLKRKLSKGGRGAKVKGKRRVTHSGIGQYPFLQSGELMNSIGSKVSIIGSTILMIFGSIRTGGKPVDYAEALEKKSPQKGGRPWLSRTVKDWLLRVRKSIIEAIHRTGL